MLRTALLGEVNRAISLNSYFKENDFLVNNRLEKDVSILHIQYRFEPTYEYKASIPNQKSYSYSPPDFKIDVRMMPGEISETENFACVGKDALIKSIRQWLDRVREELLSNPVYRQSAEQRAELELLLSQFQDLKDEYFSREEAEQLKRRLDELEEKLAENIKNSISNENEQNQRIQAIDNDINTLKVNLDSHKKRGWAGSLAVRILDWTKDPLNRKVLTSGAQVAKDLLLEAGKHIHEGK